MLTELPTGTSKSLSGNSLSETGCARPHILTINVEDYFQAGVFHRFVDSDNWYRFDSRLQKNLEYTLSVLAEHDTKATFFVLGWIAEKLPNLIRMISDQGHEVASRGYLHQPLLSLDRAERADDLSRSRAVLEYVTGHEVAGFRLSDGWLRKKDLGFLEEVFDAGYRYDSSLMPRHRDFRSDSSSRTVHHQQTRSGSLLEVPLSTLPVAGAWLPISGGNYLRQFPNAIMKRAVQRWTENETSPFVMYFQIWELDAEQPRVSAVSRLSQIRHYRNLGIYRTLLPEYLKTWKFTSVRDHARIPQSPLQDLTSPHCYSLRLRPAQQPKSIRSEYPPEPVTIRIPSATVNTAKSATVSSASVQPTDEIAQDGSTSLRRADRRTPVTLVIPCYNEEGSLPYLARTLEHLRGALASDYHLHVLFVDDCSRDNTRETLRALFADESDVRIVCHEVNKGVSAAILTGLEAATTDIVCSIDCDCSYDPHELLKMLPLMKPGVAMVTASPYHPNGRVKNVPGWRLCLSHGLSTIYRAVFGQKLSTWTSCFRVYRRSQILDLPLNESGFLGTAELAAQLCLHKREIAEHPAVLEVRLFGASKMKTLRTIRSHLRLLARLILQKMMPGNADL
ncbi:MAG: glycosyltransferase [Planctomyces sp.]|jgi:polysaccharide deacetylase family protein (PEP-CTERM system associated)